MEVSLALGLLAGFAFLLTFNNLPWHRAVAIAAVIMSLVAVGYEASTLARNRMNYRTTSTITRMGN